MMEQFITEHRQELGLPAEHAQKWELYHVIRSVCHRNRKDLAEKLFPALLSPDVKIVYSATGADQREVRIHSNPVCLAVIWCQDDCILRYLLSSRASCHVKHVTIATDTSLPVDEESPLSLAVSRRQIETISLLLEHGALGDRAAEDEDLEHGTLGDGAVGDRDQELEDPGTPPGIGGLKHGSREYCAHAHRSLKNRLFREETLPRGVSTDTLRGLVLLACIHRQLSWLERIVAAGEDILREGCYPVLWLLLPGVKHLAPDRVRIGKADLCTVRGTIGEEEAEDQVRVLQFLLSRGADPNQADPGSGRRAAHLLHMSGRPGEVASLLLQHGMNIRAQDKQGRTAMHYAALANNLALINLLSKHDSDLIHRPDTEGCLPLHALGYKPKYSAFMMSKSRENPSKSQQINDEKISIIKYMTSYGVSLDATDGKGQTLADLLCGRSMYNATLQWLLRMPIVLPEVKPYEKFLSVTSFSSTDCLLPAGTHRKDFVQGHIALSLVTNNYSRYVTARRANPYALYSVKLDILMTTCFRHFVDADSALRSMAVESEKTERCTLMKIANTDQKTTPSLTDVCTFCIRSQLLKVHGNRTLHHLIELLPLPKLLKTAVTLDP